MANQNPYHVRLAISQYGDQFRAELFTEDLGDTEGDLLPALKDITISDQPLNEWLGYLTGGWATLASDIAQNIGKKLFMYMLGAEQNRDKWNQVLDRAINQDRPIRILIDATTDAVRDLPYGLLCDSQNHYYLFRRGKGHPEIRFVRILRWCTPRLLNLHRKPLRVLVVAAEPDKVSGFGCANILRQLLQSIPESFDVSICSSSDVHEVNDVLSAPPETWQPEQLQPFCRTTRTVLQSALQEGEFDILHLMTHGIGTGLLLCDATGARHDVSANELGEWCGASRLQMAFLQVCKAGQTGERGRFGGLAHQLLNPKQGDLSAVVASPYPVDADQSTQTAKSFYQYLSEEKSLDAALDRTLSETNWSWAFLELWVRPGALEDPGTRGDFQFPRPYRGLSRFEERDTEIFFGRTEEVNDLLKNLEDEPIVTVFGDSGSGKSSLLQAGLGHHVRQAGLLGKTDWRIISLPPGPQPARNLIAVLASEKQAVQIDYSAETFEEWYKTLSTLFDRDLRGNRPVLLIFDQFEELFTVCDDEDQRRAVAEILVGVTQQYKDHVRVVLGIRSEYLGATASLHGNLIRCHQALKLPGTEHIHAIVSEPAGKHGYTFQEGLLEQILNDPLLSTSSSASPISSKTSTPLPLLEFALERLWLKAVSRGSQVFSYDDYEHLDGLGGAIAHHADEVYEDLPNHPELGVEAQRLAEKIITGLVSSKRTRRPRPRNELQEETGNPDLACRVIDHLVGERLLTLRGHSNNPNEAQLDLTHEILINRWDRLNRWLAEDPEGRALKEAFQKDFEQWNEGVANTSPRSRKLLPAQDIVTTYITWMNKSHPSLTEQEGSVTK